MENGALKMCLELRKRKEKIIVTITEEDLLKNSDKILQILKKECVDLRSWLYIILYYYSKEDYSTFKRFSDELSKTEIDLNPFYKDQKQLFIYILNILSLFYCFISQKSKEKEKYDQYSTLSTSLFNQAEKISRIDPMTMICKGFLYFSQGDYDNSDMYFSNIPENDRLVNGNRSILILLRIGKALNAYNKTNYSKAIDYFLSLIRDFDYINENILESLGICYYNLGNVKKAKEIFWKVMELNPNNYKVDTYLAVINLLNMDQESFANCFDHIQKAFLLDEESEFSFLLINIANIFLIAGKIKESTGICAKLNSLLEYGEMKYMSRDTANNKSDKYRKDIDEIKSAVYCLNAKIQHCLKSNVEAFGWYLKAVQANSKNIEAQFGLGQIYLIMQNLTEAEKCFEVCKTTLESSSSSQVGNSQISKLNQSNSNNSMCFAVIKYLSFIYSKTRRKEVDNTIDLFKKAIEIKNDDIDCLIELAQMLEIRKPEESLKYYDEALQYIRKSIQEQSDDANNNENMNILSHCMYNPDEILPEILNNIACIKIRLHLFSDVEQLLNEALSIVKLRKDVVKKGMANDINTSDGEKHARYVALELSIIFNFGLFYESKNEFGEAYGLYKKIIKENPYFIEAYIKLGELAKARGNRVKATEYIKLAIEKHFANDESSNSKDPKAKSSSQKLISIMNKPINPLLIMAQIHYENGNENDALSILCSIKKEYDNKDPYTLVFMGNIYYDLACQVRTKRPDFEYRLNKSLELYFQAIEADKYNAFAAIGVANVLSEYNFTNQSLESYKVVMEKMSTNYNSYVNESLIYINENKFEKATIILNKILKKFFNSKFPEIENLLAMALIEMKDFARANKVLKCLMLRYPENIYYKFNYALSMKARSEEILSKKERKVRETEEAIHNLEKAIGIFVAINSIRKEINANFKNEKDEKVLKSSEFYYKCVDVLNLCKYSLGTAKNYLETDTIREQEILKKIEEDRIRYNQILESQKELNEKQLAEIRRQKEENEKLYESFREKGETMIKKSDEDKEKVKQGRRKKKPEEGNIFIANEDEEDNNEEVNRNKESESDREKKNIHKRHRHHRKRKREEDNEENDGEGNNLNDQEHGQGVPHDAEEGDGNKRRKLRKKRRFDPMEVEEQVEVEHKEEEEKTEQNDEKNVKEEDKMPQEENIIPIPHDQLEKESETEKQKENENENEKEKEKEEIIVKEIVMKDYTKNYPEEEADFS